MHRASSPLERSPGPSHPASGAQAPGLLDCLSWPSVPPLVQRREASGVGTWPRSLLFPLAPARESSGTKGNRLLTVSLQLPIKPVASATCPWEHCPSWSCKDGCTRCALAAPQPGAGASQQPCRGSVQVRPTRLVLYAFHTPLRPLGLPRQRHAGQPERTPGAHDGSALHVAQTAPPPPSPLLPAPELPTCGGLPSLRVTFLPWGPAFSTDWTLVIRLCPGMVLGSLLCPHSLCFLGICLVAG